MTSRSNQARPVFLRLSIARAAVAGLATAIGGVAGAGGPVAESVPTAQSKPAEKDGEDGVARHASPELLAERGALIPGEITWIGVRFKIEEGWHLYWNGRNESGSPPNFVPTLPEGYTLGEWLWPAPTRHVAPGEILDHVYEGSVLLMAPLTVPADAKPGSSVTLKIAADWVVCDSGMCVPEEGSVALSIRVGHRPGAGAAPEPEAPTHAIAFEQARTRHPQAWPAAAQGFSQRITTAKSGRVLELRVAGASALEFYPASESAEVEGLLAKGRVSGETLALPLREGGDATMPVRGVLAVARRGGKPTEFYKVDTGSAAGPADRPTNARPVAKPGVEGSTK